MDSNEVDNKILDILYNRWLKENKVVDFNFLNIIENFSSIDTLFVFLNDLILF